MGDRAFGMFGILVTAPMLLACSAISVYPHYLGPPPPTNINVAGSKPADGPAHDCSDMVCNPARCNVPGKPIVIAPSMSNIETHLGKLDKDIDGIAKAVGKFDRKLDDQLCSRPSSCSDTGRLIVLTESISRVESRVEKLDEALSGVVKTVNEVNRKLG